MVLEDIEFQIANIEIFGFSFHKPASVIHKGTPFKFQTHISHKVRLADDTIDVVCAFDIYRDDDADALAKAEISCLYEVKNLDSFIKGSGKLSLPERFISVLNTTSLSTCRGILFALFRGTPLHSVLLPLVDKNLLKTSSVKE